MSKLYVGYVDESERQDAHWRFGFVDNADRDGADDEVKIEAEKTFLAVRYGNVPEEADVGESIFESETKMHHSATVNEDGTVVVVADSIESFARAFVVELIEMEFESHDHADSSINWDQLRARVTKG